MSARRHDLIVVGAGIGGLTAAALAADAGLDTVALEAHTRPGGCAGDFTRRGILFPAGATLVMGFEPGGLHHAVYQQLGLPIRARRLDLAMTVHLPDRAVRVPTDAGAWEAERRRAFPELGARGDRFWTRVRSLAGTAYDLAADRPSPPFGSLGDLLAGARLLRPGLLGALPSLGQSVGDLLRAHGLDGEPAHRRFVDLQLLISMQCLADECVALNGALALDVYRYGAFALPHGPATIARDLVAALRDRGGQCEYRAPVRALQQTGDTWTAVLADGREVRARTVVANLPPTNVLDLLGDQAPRSLYLAAHRRVQPWGAVVLYAAIDPAGLGGPLPRYHQTLTAYDRSVEDGGSCFVSVFGPDPGRPEAARLTVSTHTRVEPWWSAADPAAYDERKQWIGERLLAAAEQAIPDVRRRLLFSEVATPRGYWRWTSRHEGRVGGVPQTRRHANLFALSHRTDLPGLYLCGDSVFPGQGTIGVTLSGINAARAVIRRLTGRPAPRPTPTLASTGIVGGLGQESEESAPRATRATECVGN